MPGLDGLRGLAVLAVVAYHLGLPGSRGGFLGVDIFFVVSGFLVTVLLLGEVATEGFINIREFWLRRTRRLMPALITLLAATAVVYGFRVREKLAAGRLDILAGLFYVGNWRSIASSSSYFDSLGRPPLTRHLWSLAIEGQFYAIWPLVLVALLVVCEGERRRMASLCTVIGLISAAWGAVLFKPDADPSRVYFGTDTRLIALLLGASLAFAAAPFGRLRPLNQRGRRSLTAVGFAGLAALVAATIVVSDRATYLYRGGFAVIAIVAVMVVYAAAADTTVARLLSLRTIRWVGLRSYSLYLWHWPVIAMTQPGIDVPVEMNRWTLVVIRLGVSMLLTEASYRLIEIPFRRKVFSRWVASLAGRPDGLHRSARWYAGTLAGALLLVGGAAGVSRAAQNDGIADSLRDPSNEVVVPDDTDGGLGTTVTTLDPTTEPGLVGLDAISMLMAPGSAALPPPSARFPEAPPNPALPRPTIKAVAGRPAVAVANVTTTLPRPPRVLAIGDSVMKGAALALAPRLGEGSVIDATVSRPFTDGRKVYAAQTAKGRTFGAIVIHLGNNGVPSKKQFAALLDDIGPRTPVIFVTMRESREWAPKLNALLREESAIRSNMAILDWNAASKNYSYMFAKDRLHLTPVGGTYYGDLVVWALAQVGYVGKPSTTAGSVPPATPPATLPTSSATTTVGTTGATTTVHGGTTTTPTSSTSVPTTTVVAAGATAITSVNSTAAPASAGPTPPPGG